jgi:ketosteroid isomerase-like protein
MNGRSGGAVRVTSSSHTMDTTMTRNPEDDLRRAEGRLFAAIAARDIEALDAELTDDFVYTQIGVADQDREAFLAAIRDMPFRILDLRGESLKARIMGDVGVLSGVQQAQVEMPDGTVVSGTTAFVDVFVMTANGWRLQHACSIELQQGSGNAS